MLALAYSHEHEWQRYVLRSDGDETIKEYTEAEVEQIPGFFFIGYDCECGDGGYDLSP
jgi:hypothetical protein